MLSSIIAGMLLLFVATIQFNKSFFKIPPAALGAVTFIVAAVLCITQVNYYFGIGVPSGSAFETLAAYRSFGFHSNWRGVLYGTITLVIMITYPIKFKKLSRKVPAPAVALVLTTVLNLILNPVAERTAIDEVGAFVSSPSFMLVGDISIFDVTPESCSRRSYMLGRLWSSLSPTRCLEKTGFRPFAVRLRLRASGR